MLETEFERVPKFKDMPPSVQAFETYFATPAELRGEDVADRLPEPQDFINAALDALDAIRKGQDPIGAKFPDAAKFIPEIRGHEDEILRHLGDIAGRLVESRYGSLVGAKVYLAGQDSAGIPFITRFFADRRIARGL